MTVSPEDGPVALLPVEVEGCSIKQELLDAELALEEWRMMQVCVYVEHITMHAAISTQRGSSRMYLAVWVARGGVVVGCLRGGGGVAEGSRVIGDTKKGK